MVGDDGGHDGDYCDDGDDDDGNGDSAHICDRLANTNKTFS
jgi:hypothetical protein